MPLIQKWELCITHVLGQAMVHPLQEKVAEGLVGSEVEVFKEKVVVREVTGFTMMD